MDIKFCDGVKNIGIDGGVVRIDFYHNGEVTEGERDKELSHQVILTPEAFLQTYTALDQVVNELVDKGLLTRKEKA